MAYEGLMVSVSGVRGRVGEALTPEIIAKFAAGFGAWALARSAGVRSVRPRSATVSQPKRYAIQAMTMPNAPATSDAKRPGGRRG